MRAALRDSWRVTGGMEEVDGKEGRSKTQRPSPGALRPVRNGGALGEAWMVTVVLVKVAEPLGRVRVETEKRL